MKTPMITRKVKLQSQSHTFPGIASSPGYEVWIQLIHRLPEVAT